jgi:hypothetical protein
MSVPLVTMSFPGEHEGSLEKLTVLSNVGVGEHGTSKCQDSRLSNESFQT